MIQIDMDKPKDCIWADITNHIYYCPLLNEYHKCNLQDYEPRTIEEQYVHCPLHEADPDTVSRQDARMCLTGDVTDMSIEQYIEMVDKRLQQLQPSPSRPSEQHISSLETPCDHCYFFTHKCTYPGKCADRAIWEAAHEGGAV